MINQRGILNLLAGGVGLLLCYGAWWLWNEVPRWLRGTEFSDFSFLASLLAIFLLLSLLNPLLGKVWQKLTESTSETNSESE